jgi:hypothetical protein
LIQADLAALRAEQEQAVELAPQFLPPTPLVFAATTPMFPF